MPPECSRKKHSRKSVRQNMIGTIAKSVVVHPRPRPHCFSYPTRTPRLAHSMDGIAVIGTISPKKEFSISRDNIESKYAYSDEKSPRDEVRQYAEKKKDPRGSLDCSPVLEHFKHRISPALPYTPLKWRRQRTQRCPLLSCHASNLKMPPANSQHCQPTP